MKKLMLVFIIILLTACGTQIPEGMDATFYKTTKNITKNLEACEKDRDRCTPKFDQAFDDFVVLYERFEKDPTKFSAPEMFVVITLLGAINGHLEYVVDDSLTGHVIFLRHLETVKAELNLN